MDRLRQQPQGGSPALALTGAVPHDGEHGEPHPRARPTRSHLHKSTYSDASGGNCLEVGDSHPVPVRDSKNSPHGPTLVFHAPAWSPFVSDIKSRTA
ncbi:DUF397 domain-containing protein [Streptomyces sp. G45]|uniref:DUF397 domain-containing protein n=1 Tax=Streptomyces sp. G45 TaxID=3406627 RepID=UPI003C1F9506